MSNNTNPSADYSNANGAIVIVGVKRSADTSPTSGDNQYHPLVFDSDGNLKTNIKVLSGGTVNVGNTPAVSLSGGTTNIGNTPTVIVQSIPAVILAGGTSSIGSVILSGGTTNIGNKPSVDVATLPSVILAGGTSNIGIVSLSGGTTNIGNQPKVDVASIPYIIIGGGTSNIGSVNLAGGTTNIGNEVAVYGTVAHDSADSGNPVKIGIVAFAHGTNPTPVTASDRTNWYGNRHGIPFTIGGHPNVIGREYMTTAAQTNDAIIENVPTNSRIVITAIDATLDGDTTVAVKVRIGFGSSAVPTEPTSGNSATGMVLSHPDLKAGSGIAKGTGAGILAIGGDGEELRITCDAPTSGQLTVMVHYYMIDS